MAKKRPPDHTKNSYEDDDLRQVLAELDEMDDEAEEILASARGKVSAIRTRQKNRIKIADKELRIPPPLVRALRAQRKLERQLKMVAKTVPDDLIEVYEDASGQFSMFAPAAGEEKTETAAEAAAHQRAADIAAQTEREQAEGAAALDELAGVVH